ncbi:MAG: DUF2924 domain-containing protein [Candidatus Omnitrophota bacterium]
MEQVKLKEIMGYKDYTLAELKAKYKALYGPESATPSNKVYLWRKIAYKLQEIEHGGLSSQAQGKIEEFIQKYDPVNNKALRPIDVSDIKGKKSKLSRDKPLDFARDRRLPIPGTLITKEYKDIHLEIKVLEKGFEYNKKHYRSLTAIAKEVTGAHWNGYLFFNL